MSIIGIALLCFYAYVFMDIAKTYEEKRKAKK
jgi:hypothetical protein